MSSRSRKSSVLQAGGAADPGLPELSDRLVDSVSRLDQETNLALLLGEDVRRNRIPNLFEVLARRTLPPVDLFSFYIYMRDQQRSVDYLDFWYVS